MKLIATLPEAKHYRPLQSDRKGRWLFEDRGTALLRIISPSPSPFGHRWKLVFQPQHQKADRSQYPYRLNIKLFPVDDEPGIAIAEMSREEVKGIYGWTNRPTISFFAFPKADHLWIFYSFY